MTIAVGTVGYSTKYALTRGIEEVKVYAGERDEVVYANDVTKLIVGKTFFLSRRDAAANALEQASRKLASIEKQRAKLAELAAAPKWKSKEWQGHAIALDEEEP